MLRSNEIEFRVRYQETDAMGVVHHGNYATYFEMGRTELLRANGGTYRQMEEAGFLLVVVRMNCRFHKPAHYDDLLRLRTTTTRVSAVKVEHTYEIFRDQDLIMRGETVLACVDRQGVVQRIPEWMRTE